MSHLTYSNYEGFGQQMKERMYYSQAVRVGDVIEISGQGGWDPSSADIAMSHDIPTQIAQAFANVERALKDAGSRGWEDVFSIRTYHVPMCDESLHAVVEQLKKWCPNHGPVWTAVGAQRLGHDDMRIEVEVRAHVPRGQVEGKGA